MDEERLIVSLEARIREFEKNMAKAERRGTHSFTRLQRGSKMATSAMERDMIRSTSRINQALATTSSKIGLLSKAFAAGAIAAGMAAITQGSRQAVRSIADLERAASRAGLSVTAFQQIKFVAEQNRIDIGAMIDGFKELNLRADEFISTGAGPAAEAFRRLGYDARDLERRLEDPTELFLDLVDRLEDLDRAAQIRVADEVFGGTGGERFVELLAQGDEGIRQLMTRADELGLVMDERTIAKAAELDQKFAEITARVSTLAKTIVVDLAGSIEDALTIGVDDIFGSAERAISMMGEANYNALKDTASLTDETRASVEGLIGTYDELFASINAATGPDGIRLMDVADVDVAHELAAVLVDIDREMVAFQNGEIAAADFEAQVGSLVGEAQILVGELGAIDAQRFGNVIQAISGIAIALANAAAQAANLRANLPVGNSETELTYGPQNGRPRYNSPGSDTAPRTSPRPKLPSVNHSFGVPGRTVSRGGGGGGGARRGSGGGGGGARQRPDGFARELERTREDIALLEAEAVALLAVAQSGREYGDAVEFAKVRAKLLYEAQQAGKEITPELTAEIDSLAYAYDQAGLAAEKAAEKLERMEDDAQRGADAMSDLFLSILDGSKSAKEALADLLVQIARVQIQRAFSDMASSGGFFGLLGGLLGGARAGGGPTRSGVPYLVNERTARSEIFVPSQSGGVLNVPQAQAALRQQAGGASGTVTLNFAPVIDAKGADAAAVAQLAAEQKMLANSFEGRVYDAMRKARRRNIQL